MLSRTCPNCSWGIINERYRCGSCGYQMASATYVEVNEYPSVADDPDSEPRFITTPAGNTGAERGFGRVPYGDHVSERGFGRVSYEEPDVEPGFVAVPLRDPSSETTFITVPAVRTTATGLFVIAGALIAVLLVMSTLLGSVCYAKSTGTLEENETISEITETVVHWRDNLPSMDEWGENLSVVE